jgi:hypothetical protein
MGLLHMTPGAYPATYRVMHIANLLATFTVMYAKDHYQRPRPSHVLPALMPPIPNPGHAAFPSGHATQAHLIRLTLHEVFVEAGFGTGTANDLTVMDNDLLVLASRIARNREIAGLHYASDSIGGRRLAEYLIELLIPHPSGGGTVVYPVGRFHDAVVAAASEWM